MKILAIGDIHTKTWILDKVEKLLPDYDEVIFCGDYADNWRASSFDTLKTWRRLMSMPVKAVIGNHDFAYIHPEIAGHSGGYNPETASLVNLPDNKDVKEFLLSLPITLELDGVTYSHAGVSETWNFSEDIYDLWSHESPIWARPREFGGHTIYKNTPQVIGHNASEKIWNPQEGIWCIDTFSEHTDNTRIGDQTVLEIIDGKEFRVVKLSDLVEKDENKNNNNIAGIKNRIS